MLSKYKKNNIVFRIASADAISKFKSTQAQSFIQLARKELCFDDAAKEVVLLEFDRFSQWIFTIERIFMNSGEKVILPELKSTVIELFAAELDVIEGVIECHREVFTEEVRHFTKMVHRYSVAMLEAAFQKAMLEKIDKAFSEVISLIGNYLQHLLIAMHEFNNNIIKKKEEPFLSVSGFCVDCGGIKDFMPMIKRAQFFIEHGIKNEFRFKNYSHDELFDQTRKYLIAFNIRLILDELVVDKV